MEKENSFFDDWLESTDESSKVAKLIREHRKDGQVLVDDLFDALKNIWEEDDEDQSPED